MGACYVDIPGVNDCRTNIAWYRFTVHLSIDRWNHPFLYPVTPAKPSTVSYLPQKGNVTSIKDVKNSAVDVERSRLMRFRHSSAPATSSLFRLVLSTFLINVLRVTFCVVSFLKQNSLCNPFIFGRPFVKRFALCYRTVVCPVCPVWHVGVLLWPNGWTDQDATWYKGRPRPRQHCDRWRPSSSPTESSPPIGPCRLWRNGRPSQQLLRSSC